VPVKEKIQTHPNRIVLSQNRLLGIVLDNIRLSEDVHGEQRILQDKNIYSLVALQEYDRNLYQLYKLDNDHVLVIGRPVPQKDVAVVLIVTVKEKKFSVKRLGTIPQCIVFIDKFYVQEKLKQDLFTICSAFFDVEIKV
jgi:hypothetical protein